MSGHPRLLDRKFNWNEAGRYRVASAILETLRYNKQHSLEPRSLRSLARLAGFGENHSSIRKYSKAQIEDPEKQNWMVIRAIAQYIYRVTAVERSPAGEIVVRHQEPDPSVSIPPWQQGVTYDNWEEFARLGTPEGNTLESIEQSQQQPLTQAIQANLTAAGGFRKVAQSIDPEALADIIDGTRFPSYAELVVLSGAIGLSIDRLVDLRNKQFDLLGVSQPAVSSEVKPQYSQGMTDRALRILILNLIEKKGGVDRLVDATPLDEAGRKRLRGFLRGRQSLLVDDLNAVAWGLSEITGQDYRAIDLLSVKLAQIEDPDSSQGSATQV